MYALTKGIYRTTGELHRNGYFYAPGQVTPKHNHATRAEAVKCAEEMRTKKIASLKRQIARLEKIDFGA